MRFLLIVLLLAISTTAIANDRSACDGGDRKACARIGRLKQLGAAKPDGSPDVDKLIVVCGKALEAPTFSDVARACGLLFNADAARAWDALGAIGDASSEPLLGQGYAEAYCPLLAKPVAGCKGKKADNFDHLQGAQLRAAVSALNAAGLETELGAAKAKPLAAKFDAAWARLFK